MSGFYSISLLPKNKRELVEKVATIFESDFQQNIQPNAWFNFKYLADNTYFGEYYLDSINLKERTGNAYSNFSKKIDGFFANLETSDGENSNLSLYNKGELVIRYSSNPESLYNSDFFLRRKNLFNKDLYNQIPFLTTENLKKLEQAYKMSLDKPYYEICKILMISNSTYNDIR